MADFEEFLIAEFNEQHNNMRQIETSMTQMIQGFFAIEGLILAGALSLLSINVPADTLIIIMAPIFWFLFLFGHLTYQIAIYSFTSIVVIDFQNTIVRKYFGQKYGKEEYLYFMLNPEVNTGGTQGDWEEVKDSRSATAKFVGVVNAVNLLMSLSASLFVVLRIAYPIVDLSTLSIRYLMLILGVQIVAGIVIQKIYYQIVFLRTVRREEQITLQRRQELLKRISHDILSVESSLEKK